MKQLLILSGKGGTGKTTLANAFIELSKAKAFADCDVEAPNLHLVKHGSNKKLKPFYGLKKAVINQDLCTQCGLCKSNCRFDSIEFTDKYVINSYRCEGCSVCEYICPQNAIEMKDNLDGETTIYRDNIVFSSAELKVGSGNSGKLVTKVKEELIANTSDEPLAIVDGSPGIGCPVIASLSGVDMVLIVTEPSVSGMSDLARIIKTAQHFRVKTAVCINKYDTNIQQNQKIENYLKGLNIDILGHIPYSSIIPKYLNQGKSIVELDFDASRNIKIIFEAAMKVLMS